MKDFGVQYVYTSPLKRAYSTAKILADKIGVELEKLEDLFPLNNGIAEGKPYAFNKEVLGEENYIKFKNSNENGLDIVFPNGESRRSLRNKTKCAIEYICKNDKYDIVGVLTHGDNLKELLHLYNFDNVSSIGNCEVIEAEYFENTGFKIVKRIKA